MGILIYNTPSGELSGGAVQHNNFRYCIYLDLVLVRTHRCWFYLPGRYDRRSVCDSSLFVKRILVLSRFFAHMRFFAVTECRVPTEKRSERGIFDT
jgi:hypothetical protein